MSTFRRSNLLFKGNKPRLFENVLYLLMFLAQHLKNTVEKRKKNCHRTTFDYKLLRAKLNLPFVLRSFSHVQSHNGFNEQSCESCQKKPVVVSPATSQPRHDQIEGDKTVQGENYAGEERCQHRSAFTLLQSLHCSIFTKLFLKMMYDSFSIDLSI